MSEHASRIATIAAIALVVVPRLSACAEAGAGDQPARWDQIRAVRMPGDLRIFWNVGRALPENDAQAAAHGFLPVALLNTYSDYPGQQRENIDEYLKGNRVNPWKKPNFFERIIRRNIASLPRAGAIFVHDIEFDFEEDIDKAWSDPAARAASGAATRDQFAAAYYKEWATWYSLPCQWAKAMRPGQPIGIYGAQPFRRDYWGISGKSAKQIDGTHAADSLLWRHIDPHVDFYIASIYVFYDQPDSIYYMASNVEENWRRTRSFGDKPLYAYEWMRYHNSNKQLEGQELAPYLIEAMAVLPFFCGARGIVLWGYEPREPRQHYRMMPLFMASLGRLADLSGNLSEATPIIDEPAHLLWREKRPLVRKMRLGRDEWIVMAVNPWQDDGKECTVDVACGTMTVSLTLRGRHTEIFHMRNGVVEGLSWSP